MKHEKGLEPTVGFQAFVFALWRGAAISVPY